jgi:hypothetical protein
LFYTNRRALVACSLLGALYLCLSLVVAGAGDRRETGHILKGTAGVFQHIQQAKIMLNSRSQLSCQVFHNQVRYVPSVRYWNLRARRVCTFEASVGVTGTSGLKFIVFRPDRPDFNNMRMAAGAVILYTHCRRS